MAAAAPNAEGLPLEIEEDASVRDDANVLDAAARWHRAAGPPRDAATNMMPRGTQRDGSTMVGSEMRKWPSAIAS